MSNRKIKKMWKKFTEGRGDWPYGFTCVSPGSYAWIEGLKIPDEIRFENGSRISVRLTASHSLFSYMGQPYDF